ncbi:uncharacterized protein PITG_03935 [Phytophthora infestans T30-4]|uniref:Uncharacterized protein n=1 Tax=Phytophthora infestans (strain T30-4) TaxID=403677 RepID=D0MYX1_PHYIT|nr:uncharacterized protein PITG_03935 [Phytophthora infestans T30-4]EEY66369.1 hypothetical protein PITG_03935 [Phytophthora infestans T30-4]|eukprot:XP_002906968.1 hypothetical protein PITG_03935 [Phytophthora infestans T30-4]
MGANPVLGWVISRGMDNLVVCVVEAKICRSYETLSPWPSKRASLLSVFGLSSANDASTNREMLTGDTCRRRTGEVLDEGSKAMSVRYGVAEPDCPVGTTADGGFDGNKSTAVLCESEPEDLNVGVDSKPDVDKIRNADKVSLEADTVDASGLKAGVSRDFFGGVEDWT